MLHAAAQQIIAQERASDGLEFGHSPSSSSAICAAPRTSLPDVFRMLNLLGAHMPIRRSGLDEEVANIDAIASLAEETRRPLPIVKEIYDAEFARLKDGARITDYLVLFASRRARDALAQHPS